MSRVMFKHFQTGLVGGAPRNVLLVPAGRKYEILGGLLSAQNQAVTACQLLNQPAAGATQVVTPAAALAAGTFYASVVPPAPFVCWAGEQLQVFATPGTLQFHLWVTYIDVGPG